MEVEILCHYKQINNYLITKLIPLLLEKKDSRQNSQFQVMSD